jgi:serpin B
VLARRSRLWAAIASLLAGSSPAAHAGSVDVPALTAAYNASGQALYAELARAPGNIVLSPYSIGSAMAMARTGARGETETQMTAVLRHTLAREAADAANAALLNMLNRYDGSAAAPARLDAANALMLAKRGGVIAPGYRALVQEKYAAGVHEGATLDTVNDWVKQRTDGKIDSILDELPENAAAVLLNAVYLKATWAQRFIAKATSEADFKLSPTQKVPVPTMHRQAMYRLAERAGYRAIRLDYTARGLGMIVVLPNDLDGVDAVARTADAGEIKALRTALGEGQPKLVAVALPRFKAAYKASLAKLFRLAGMTLAFDDKADFTGMTGKGASVPGVKIGTILHRATVEVGEEGTEAAAATAVVIMERSAPAAKGQARVPIPFVVDRPFLFYIVDDASGAILFQGRIADPRAS